MFVPHNCLVKCCTYVNTKIEHLTLSCNNNKVFTQHAWVFFNNAFHEVLTLTYTILATFFFYLNSTATNSFWQGSYYVKPSYYIKPSYYVKRIESCYIAQSHISSRSSIPRGDDRGKIFRMRLQN